MPLEIMRQKILLVIAGLSLSALALPPVAARSATSALSEIVLTDYVGSGDARADWPEYISRIVLRRDGSAVYIGNAHYARLKGRFEGRFAPAQFERIAKLVPASLKLRPSYNQYAGHQVARTVFGLKRGGKTLESTDYESSGPPALLQARKIVDGLEWKINWKKDLRLDRLSAGLSGVRGFAVRGSMRTVAMLGVPTTRSLAYAIVVLRDLSGREVARGKTDRAGQFCVLAEPGVYKVSLLVPRSSGLVPRSLQGKIVVSHHRFSDASFDTPDAEPTDPSVVLLR